MPLTRIQSLGITDGTIVNADINASAAIASTKLSGVQGKFESALLHVRDEKSATTTGGTFTSGAFQTRTLNTSVTNEISGASLASNQITLPSGTYYIYATVPGYAVNNHKAKLRNITDSADTIIGTNARADTNYNGFTTSFVTGRFTIAATKTFEIQHRSSFTLATEGFGGASSFSVIEVYTDVQIWKVA
jgi:hypothetical protein